jgi:hypothetical protein
MKKMPRTKSRRGQISGGGNDACHLLPQGFTFLAQ